MHTYISPQNLKFLLYEVLEADKLNRFSYYQAFDREAFDMSLEAAKQLADTYLYPFLTETDKQKAVFEDGVVKTHPSIRKMIKAIAEGGWIAAHLPEAYGGLQMPLSLLNAGLATFYAASVNGCYPFLTQGAANLILNFGSEDLKNTYLPHMLNGDWQGTMALTEPQAGSSLSDLTTRAEPMPQDGVYRIKGQKIFISGGDHDGVDNVVHLLLARIDGAPAGTKGISLFVVPKNRPEGGNWVPNDVLCAGIYGKMGQKGYVAAHLMYGENDDCLGYLVGEPHKGLSYMFQMMNEARIGTGLVAAGTASAAYYASLKYAHERAQGRKPDSKNPTEAPIPIIEHADVRRLLLFQKAVVEGSFGLLLHCSYLSDLVHVAEASEAEAAHLLLELLTPIAKSYPAEMGIQSVSAGIQVLGGAGYCNDFPLEQLYRDQRVNAIYEGTTAIHGLDILGRKITMHEGRAVKILAEAVMQTIQEAQKWPELADFAQKLGLSAQSVQKTTQTLLTEGAKKGVVSLLADATLYLEYFSLFVMAWEWLKQGIAAQKALEAGANDPVFYKSKYQTLRYFYDYELPKMRALEPQILNFDKVTLDIAATDLV